MTVPGAVRILEHDGSFPGFLCAVAEALNDRAAGLAMPSVRPAGTSPGLFEEAEGVPRDDGRARSLWLRLSRRFGAATMRTLLEAFSSDQAGADAAVAAMACRLWAEGTRALDDLASPEAALLEKAACRTRAEAHHYSGIARFSELADGSWYAPIEPACDIVALVADHFAARFPLMRWVLADLGRSKAAMHEPGAGWRLAEGFAIGTDPRHQGRVAAQGVAPPRGDGPADASLGGLPLSGNETELRAAWTRYFGAVSITERENPDLQRSHLPLKNRRHMTEFR